MKFALPTRSADTHKGDYGHVLLIGGSRSMPGAISLSAMAAIRSGAGLVTVATPSGVQPIVAGFDPCYMTIPLAEDSNGLAAGAAREQIDAALARADCFAVGPGLGVSPATIELVAWLFRESDKIGVFDADALNSLARLAAPLESPGGPRILTPHPGEFARIAGVRTDDRTAAEAEAVRLAGHTGVTLVLKGHRSFVTDGRREYRNTTGNAGMATGGAGDVLTGMVAALLAQTPDPFTAAAIAVHVHGSAGDDAAQRLGQISISARDILDSLPAAFSRVQAGES